MSVAIEQSLRQSFAFEEVLMFCQAMSWTATKSLGKRLKPLVERRVLVELELTVVFHQGVQLAVLQLQLSEQCVDVHKRQSSGERAAT
jgi:hypothetical protein